jgi:hypothetical protein
MRLLSQTTWSPLVDRSGGGLYLLQFEDACAGSATKAGGR